MAGLKGLPQNNSSKGAKPTPTAGNRKGAAPTPAHKPSPAGRPRTVAPAAAAPVASTPEALSCPAQVVKITPGGLFLVSIQKDESPNCFGSLYFPGDSGLEVGQTFNVLVSFA